MKYLATLLLGALLCSASAYSADWFELIPSESLKNEGTSIVPNEGLVHLFEPVNRPQRGALIAVGTFRALAAASQGSFTYGFFVDGDQGVVDFNRMQIEALRRSPTIAEFLATVAGVESMAGDFARALGGDKTALHRIQGLMPHWSVGPRASDRFRYALSLMDLAQIDPGTTFLTNNRAYDRLRKLALADRLFAIAGDLAGKKTLRELSTLMKAHRVYVSALDVSNAPDYIIMSRKTAGYLDNLRLLPFSRNAVVSFTAERSSYSHAWSTRYAHVAERGFGWIYLSVGAKDYVRAAEAFVDATSPYFKGSYPDFVNSLVNTPADLAPPKPSCKLVFGF